MQDLNGKVAVVTGGGSGIGRALAHALADEGMDVAIGDIEPDAAGRVADEVRAKGRRAAAVACDVTDLASMRALAAAARTELGGAHVLCNNAGVVAGKPTAEMSESDWAWVLGVDLHGVVNGLQAFLPELVAQGEGHVVNTSSIAGLVPLAAPNIISYTTAKYGVVGITETLHEELRPHGVGASVLCPGVVNTRIGESARNRPGAAGGPSGAPEPLIPASGEPPRIVGANVIEPDVVAQRVVAAVRNNDLYVVTHPETREAVEARFAAILAAYDRLDASLAGG